MYKVSDFAREVSADLLTDVELINKVDGMHQTMRAEGERLLKARREAARLISGEAPYDVLWRDPLAGGYDPQQIDIHADRLVSACGHITDMAPYPRAVVGELLALIASIDPAHPFAANAALFAAACTGMDEAAPEWQVP